MPETTLKEYALSANKMCLQDTQTGIHYEFRFDYTEPNKGHTRFVHLNLDILDASDKEPKLIKEVPLTSWMIQDFMNENLTCAVLQVVKDIYYCSIHTEPRLQSFTAGGLPALVQLLIHINKLTEEAQQRLSNLSTYLELRFTSLVEEPLIFDDGLGGRYNFTINLTETDSTGEQYVYVDVEYYLTVGDGPALQENISPIGWRVSQFKTESSVTLAHKIMEVIVPSYLLQKLSRKAVGFDVLAVKMCDAIEKYVKRAMINYLTNVFKFSR